jgi:hypothetical protein
MLLIFEANNPQLKAPRRAIETLANYIKGRASAEDLQMVNNEIYQEKKSAHGMSSYFACDGIAMATSPREPYTWDRFVGMASEAAQASAYQLTESASYRKQSADRGWVLALAREREWQNQQIRKAYAAEHPEYKVPEEIAGRLPPLPGARSDKTRPSTAIKKRSK